MTKAHSQTDDNGGRCESCDRPESVHELQEAHPVLLGGGLGPGTMWLCPTCYQERAERKPPEVPRATHDLKCHPGPFEAVRNGRKTHEVRVNDRDYREGDVLLLREWAPATEAYTTRWLRVEVTHVTRGGEYGLPPELCVMSVRPRRRPGPAHARKKT